MNHTPTLRIGVSWPKDHIQSLFICRIHRLTGDTRCNRHTKSQNKHTHMHNVYSGIHSFSLCCSQHYFILWTTISATYTCTYTHTDRLSICVGNDSPPPPGVEPSLSRLLPLHLCEPFTSLHSSSTMEAFQSFKLAVITAKGKEWEWQHVTLHTWEHLIHWFYIEHAVFQKGSWGGNK